MNEHERHERELAEFKEALVAVKEERSRLVVQLSEARFERDRLRKALMAIQRDCNEAVEVVTLAGNHGPRLNKGRVKAMINVIYRRAGTALRQADGSEAWAMHADGSEGPARGVCAECGTPVGT